MRSVHLLLIGLLVVAITACGAPQTAQPGTTGVTAVAAAAPPTSAALATSTPAFPTATLVPTSSPRPTPAPVESLMPTAMPATATTAATPVQTAPPPATVAPPVARLGKAVLSLPAGTGEGQVGIRGRDGPASFRIGADGSIRILDTLNHRLLFFDGATGVPERTIALQGVGEPLDFAVKGTGELFVLDRAGKVALFNLNGHKQNEFALATQYRNKLKTISLTASGELWGMDDRRAYWLLSSNEGQIDPAAPAASHAGAVTVRSNARFRIEPIGNTAHLIVEAQSEPAFDQQIGVLSEDPVFLDVNQGMELYVAAKKGQSTEVRRYSPAGDLMGTLNLNQKGCRLSSRSIYVDRPGDVYTMCSDSGGVTVIRYSMVDAAGKTLPRYSKLVTTAAWSPNSLQAAPG